jgi:hypothetical protein
MDGVAALRVLRGDRISEEHKKPGDALAGKGQVKEKSTQDKLTKGQNKTKNDNGVENDNTNETSEFEDDVEFVSTASP